MEWIYDRTQEDVDLVRSLNDKYLNRTITEEEKEIWNTNLKGALNASDMNRIEGNIAEIADYISVEAAWLNRVDIVTKEWGTNDKPRVSDFFRIRENVQRLRYAWYTIPSTPETPEIPFTYYEKINDIEHILHDLYHTYVITISSYDYCGEFYAGEEVATL